MQQTGNFLHLSGSIIQAKRFAMLNYLIWKSVYPVMPEYGKDVYTPISKDSSQNKTNESRFV